MITKRQIRFDESNSLYHQRLFATLPPDQFKHRSIVGGFGSGKTHSIAMLWLSLIKWRAKHQRIKTKFMIVEPAYPLAKDALIPEMDEIFDDLKIRKHYHKTDHNYTIWLNGDEYCAWVRSADNPSSLTAKSITDFCIDEFDKIKSISDQKAVWTECIARIRKAQFGTGSVVTTPEGFKYTHELWVEKHSQDPQWKLIKAKTADNHFLPPDYIENQIRL